MISINPCRNQHYFKSIFLLFFLKLFFSYSGTIYFLHSRFACTYSRHTILFLLNMLLNLMYKAIFFLYKWNPIFLLYFAFEKILNSVK